MKKHYRLNKEKFGNFCGMAAAFIGFQALCIWVMLTVLASF